MSEETKAGRPAGHGGGQAAPDVDVRERGLPKDGVPQFLDRRLFMQLLVCRVPGGKKTTEVAGQLASRFKEAGQGAVLYADVSDPRALGVLTFSEEPADFVQRVRPVLEDASCADLEFDRKMTMFGRSYSSGYENDLEFWLLRRPRETVLNEEWPWAVWYPLRRKGAFAQLDRKEQGAILREHGTIGKAYGEKDLAHDVRLACHGLDENDNEFLIGLIGKTLHPLSHVVQHMRSTRQTSEYIEKMGPFFVGHAIARSAVE